ncbi:hypothetical protein E3N88_18814 [Mikania micrantha]|uniref:Uncharacterized protein n=1 Tax=Mikania micrantha TaxID=192012 RepID=A0A5N6NP64_9ASTR|nr:hypothetical protein E3N88_18814 [Mikania micrantha]
MADEDNPIEMKDEGADLASFDPSKKRKKNKVVIHDPADGSVKQLAEQTERLSDSRTCCHLQPSSGHHQTYSSSPLRPADHYRDEGYLLLEPNLCCQPHHHQRLSRTRSMTRKEGILESGMFISLVAIVSSNWHPTTVNRVSVADGG